MNDENDKTTADDVADARSADDNLVRDSWEATSANRARYSAAMHGMQTGVAMEMMVNPGPTNPKHLRVGINAALRDHGSLVDLLVRKGIFTWEEYWQQAADGMEQERDSYAKSFGPDVTLA